MKTPTLQFLLLCAVVIPQLNADNPPVLPFYFLQQRNDAQQAFGNQSFIAASVRNDFLLKELTSEQLATQWAYKSNRFLFAANYEGLVQYGTLQLSVGYAKLFAQKLAVAARFYYLLNHAEHYSAVHSLSFDVSFQAAITPRMGLAVQVSNPARLKYGIVGDVPLPMCFSTDFYYQIATQTVLATQLSYTLNGSFNLSVQLLQQLRALHLCFTASLHHTSLLIGFTMKQIILRIETAYDWRLGMSGEVGAIFLFKKL
jgi:hypothetical protein